MSDKTLIEMLKEEEELVAEVQALEKKARQTKYRQIATAGRLRRLRRKILLVMDQEQARRTDDAMNQAMKRIENDERMRAEANNDYPEPG